MQFWTLDGHIYPTFLCYNNNFYALIFLFLDIFFDVGNFWSLYRIYYNVVSVLCSGFLAVRHVASWLPD